MPRRQHDVQSLPTYIAVSLDISVATQCRAKIADRDLERDTARRHEAVVFVVGDVAKPGYHTALVSRLLGGAIVDPTYFMTNSGKGVAIMYQPFSSSRRFIYVTPVFEGRHRSLVQTLDACVGLSKWCRVRSAEEVVEFHARDLARPKQQRRPMTMIVLALEAEKNSAALRSKKWAMGLDAFLAYVSRPGSSTKGVSGL